MARLLLIPAVLLGAAGSTAFWAAVLNRVLSIGKDTR